MQTSSDYINHVNIVKELNLYTTIRENQRPYEKRFEEIYQKAKEADVKLDTAKDFLHDLSESELGALQKFEGLADSIDIDSLTNEGAYNLLVHRYEQYDWNNDGATEIGEGRILSAIPKNMDDDTKKAWVKTLNDMGSDFMATAVITMSLNEEYIKRQVALHMSQMSDAERAKMQESASYDINQFIKETLSKPYTPKLITFLDILEKVDGILSGSNGGYSSPEMIASTQRLKEELTKAYAEVQKENKEQLTTQQEIEIKQQAAQTMRETEESPLATAIQESSQTQSVEQTKATEQQKNIHVDDVKVDTLDDRANEILNGLLVGMSDKDKGAIKLYLSFSMSIKIEGVLDGKLHIEHEHKTDRESILEKLDILSNKNKERRGDLADEISRVVNELKRLYANDTTTEDLK